MPDDVYCTAEEATVAGADPDSPYIDEAIFEASRRVDTYTGKYFGQVTETRRAVVVNGKVQGLVPVTDPVIESWDSPYPGPIWWDGQETVVETYVDGVLWNAPPWGAGQNSGAQVAWVSGTWGWEQPPPSVRRATARITALLIPMPFVPGADLEGNPMGLPPLPTADDLTTPAPPRKEPPNVDRSTNSTGDEEADALLDPWRTKIRVT